MLVSAALALAALFVANALARDAALAAQPYVLQLPGGAAVALAVLCALVLSASVARIAWRLRPLSARVAPTAMLLLATMPLLARTASAASPQPLLLLGAALLLAEIVARLDAAGPRQPRALIGAAAAALGALFGALAPVAGARLLRPSAVGTGTTTTARAAAVPSASALASWGRLFWRPLRPWLDASPLAALYADVWGDYHGRWLLPRGANSARVREQTIAYLGRANQLALLPTALMGAGLVRGLYAAVALVREDGRDRARAARALLAISGLAALVGYGLAGNVALTPLSLHAALPLSLLAADTLEVLALRSRSLHTAAMVLLSAVFAHAVPALITRAGSWPS